MIQEVHYPCFLFTDLGLDLAPDPGAAATVHDLEAAAITGWNFHYIIIHSIQNDCSLFSRYSITIYLSNT